MSIDDAIALLEKRKSSGVKHIVLAYWEADMFALNDDSAWAADADYLESEMDWSAAHDQMTELLNDYKNL